MAGATYTCDFGDPRATDPAITGGKGANLAHLTQVGLPVPAGFVVTTAAYAEFLHTDGLGEELAALFATAETSDAAALAVLSEKARELILAAPLPEALVAAIEQDYVGLGREPYVAVRSSGTAEDLEDASFAGMHDTYLDVQGSSEVVAAVKRCWSSLWTGRAVAYREQKRFVHTEVGIAVVIQLMVEAETAGVMFTGNPLNTATDELLVNASYGLGESVVSGVVTPDEFTVSASSLAAIRRNLGAKEIQIVRNRASGKGTVTEPVPAERREIYCLTDQQITDLARLGLRVQETYGGFPQDIEWAGVGGGEFVLLQARPITGVEFSWEADLEQWQAEVTGDPDDVVWTRALADVAWSGAITPLMYSIRGHAWTEAQRHEFADYGLADDVAGRRFWKFHKSEAYYNCDIERLRLDATVWPPLRPMVAECLPPDDQADFIGSAFDTAAYATCYAQVESARSNQTLRGWHDTWADTYWRDPAAIEFANGWSPERLHELSDAELRTYIDDYIGHEHRYFYDGLVGFFLHFKGMGALLGWMYLNWFGEDQGLLYDMLAGVAERTATQRENHALWEIAEHIRASEQLSETFRTRHDDAFFTSLEHTPEGRELLAQYHAFLDEHGHRGHSDRDMYFLRRVESNAVTYAALRALVTAATSEDPSIREQQLRLRHDDAVATVLAHVRDQLPGDVSTQIPHWLAAAVRPDGGTITREEAMAFTVGWMDRMTVVRDDERHFVDRYAFAIRKGLLELARRLTERGALPGEDDAWFLGREELYQLLDGQPSTPLLRAKITARRRDYDRINRREIEAAPYLKHFTGLDYRTSGHESGDGQFTGTPASAGTTTATIRIIRNLDELHRIEAGDIMVCNATDPAWTPVFLIISGIITETGGALSHAFCLAREYGLPAVQLPNAIRTLRDGATATLNGGQGTVVLHDTEPADSPAPVAATS